jgi:hypothetical protein
LKDLADKKQVLADKKSSLPHFTLNVLIQFPIFTSMKSALLILVVAVLSVMFYNRVVSNMPVLHSQPETEYVMDAQVQIEDNCGEDESINANITLLPFSLNGYLSKSLAPTTILGMISLIWQPPK